MHFRLYTGPEDTSYAAVLKSALFDKVFQNNVNDETFPGNEIATAYIKEATQLSKTLEGGKRACFFPTSFIFKRGEYKCKVS